MSNVNVKFLTEEQFMEFMTTGKLPVELPADSAAGTQGYSNAPAVPKSQPRKSQPPFVPDNEVPRRSTAQHERIVDRAYQVALSPDALTTHDSEALYQRAREMMDDTIKVSARGPEVVMSVIEKAFKAAYRFGYGSCASDVMIGKLKLGNG